MSHNEKKLCFYFICPVWFHNYCKLMSFSITLGDKNIDGCKSLLTHAYSAVFMTFIGLTHIKAIHGQVLKQNDNLGTIC